MKKTGAKSCGKREFENFVTVLKACRRDILQKKEPKRESFFSGKVKEGAIIGARVGFGVGAMIGATAGAFLGAVIPGGGELVEKLAAYLLAYTVGFALAALSALIGIFIGWLYKICINTSDDNHRHIHYDVAAVAGGAGIGAMGGAMNVMPMGEDVAMHDMPGMESAEDRSMGEAVLDIFFFGSLGGLEGFGMGLAVFLVGLGCHQAYCEYGREFSDEKLEQIERDESLILSM